MIARLRYAQARHRPDLAAAAPRHLFDRRPRAADLRPEAGQSEGAGVGEAGLARGRRHDRGRRGQGRRRPDHDLRPRRRHRREPAVVDPLCRHAVGTGPGRGAAGAARQRPARARHRAGRRRPQDRARRDQGRVARRGEFRLRHRADDRARLQVPAHLPPQQLRHRRGDAGRAPACEPLHRPAGARRELLPRRRRGSARAAGAAGRAHARRDRRPHRPAASRSTATTSGSEASTSRCCSPATAWCTAAIAARPRSSPRRQGWPRASMPTSPTRSRTSAAAASPTRSATPTARSARACPARSRARTATTAWPTRRWRCISTAPPDRASAPSTPAACCSNSNGEANDYVGKGMAGGRIVIRPPQGARCDAHETPILGNTCLYGATGGELYAAGRPASVSRCATPARPRSSKASATTAAST